MKKIIIILLALFMLVGCSSTTSNEPEEEEELEETVEPLGYTGPVYLRSNKKQSAKDLLDGVIGIVGIYDEEYNNYVKSQLEELGFTEDNYVEIDTFYNVPVLLEEKEIDAWIIDSEVEPIMYDYRADYDYENYYIVEEFMIPYYEETKIPDAILKDPLYTEPFVVLITGIDEAVDPDTVKGVRTDVNHVMIVNPEYHHILTISFPRDTYIQSSKTGYYNKLNALVQNGIQDPMKALGKLLGVDVEHYVQVSFTTFVKLINYIGGVWVNVPMNVHLNQDSHRNVANPQDIPKGYTHLYGEIALALSRNRKYNGIVGGDFGRIRNQALIIDGIIDKLAAHPKLFDIAEISTIYEYVAYTDFTKSQINTLIQLGKDFHDGYTIDNYFISCYDGSSEGLGYIAQIYNSSLAIARGKVQLALTGEVDMESSHVKEILTGYVTGGAGSQADGGYIGESYDLRDVFDLDIDIDLGLD